MQIKKQEKEKEEELKMELTDEDSIKLHQYKRF